MFLQYLTAISNKLILKNRSIASHVGLAAKIVLEILNAFYHFSRFWLLEKRWLVFCFFRVRAVFVK